MAGDQNPSRQLYFNHGAFPGNDTVTFCPLRQVEALDLLQQHQYSGSLLRLSIKAMSPHFQSC